MAARIGSGFLESAGNRLDLFLSDARIDEEVREARDPGSREGLAEGPLAVGGKVRELL
jgi:hypothetical protein